MRVCIFSCKSYSSRYNLSLAVLRKKLLTSCAGAILFYIVYNAAWANKEERALSLRGRARGN
jgi:hypothetical protein